MLTHGKRIYAFAVTTALSGLFALTAVASSHLAPGRISDITNTKHNFAANVEPTLPGGVTRQVKAQTQNEICVYCHTPHGKPGDTPQPFLWNRAESNPAYTFYTSDSFDSGPITSIGEPSKMCMSCHDGTVAVGQVKVVNGRVATTDIAMTGSGVETNGTVKNTNSGHQNYNLGTDLTNDHPIGFAYSDLKATDDGELVIPSNATSYIGTRVGSGVANHNAALRAQTTPPAPWDSATQPTSSKTRIAVPLENTVSTYDANAYSTITTGTVGCTSCHDPHIRSTNIDENIKFLRLHRFQKSTPSGGVFNINNDQNCLACHKKAVWHSSVHANSTDGTAMYTTDSAATRDFPTGTRVWDAGCLNCHDTHTEKGAKLLLREGAAGSVGSEVSAREETCYQCHSSTSIVTPAAKDIRTVVQLSGGHTAIGNSNEIHTVRKKNDIVDDVIANAGTNSKTALNSGNHIEKQSDLDGANRHVECGDCHHAHRMQKSTVFDGAGWSDPATLSANSTNNYKRGTSKGSMRGASGVEPTAWSSVAWGSNATAFDVLQGDLSEPSSYTGTSPVKKEYQVCLKCHSTFAPNATATKQDMEFQPAANPAGNNHRSWHPVIGSTSSGTHPVPVVTELTMNAPFNNTGAVGNQTMFCSDCHTNSDASGAKGPHGSANAKMLVATGDNLCLSCHKSTVYSNTDVPAFASPNTLIQSGFSCVGCVGATTVRGTPVPGAAQTEYNKNLHALHAASGFAVGTCTNCHTAQTHGWRDKAFLASLDGTLGTTNLVVNGPAQTVAPYFSNAKNKVATMRAANGWTGPADCTTATGCHQ